MNYHYTEAVRRQLIAILKNHAAVFIEFEDASFEEDTQHATDMKIVTKGKAIAVRIRNSDCRFRDLTIRSSNRGYCTEIDKIRKGDGDIYLYGWKDGADNIIEYLLVNIDKFRDSGLLDEKRSEIPNYDGTAFTTYSIGELEKTGCIIYKRLNK